MVCSLINESACGGIINSYDSSRYLYASGVYSRRKGSRTKPWMIERKVAQWWTYSASPLGGNCFSFSQYNNSCLRMRIAHTHKCPEPDIFSIRDIAQRANRIRKSFSSLFVARWWHIRVTSTLLVSSLLLFLSVIVFSLRKCFPLRHVNASLIRLVNSLTWCRNRLLITTFIILYLPFIFFCDNTWKYKFSALNNIFEFWHL